MAAVYSSNSLILNEMLEINTDTETKPQQNHYEAISLDDYDASKLSPVFYGWFPRKISEILVTDNEHTSSASQMQLNCANMEEENEGKSSSISEFDAAVAHPATFGYILLDKKPVVEVNVENKTPIPEPLKCKPREYCEFYIFPVLLPALEKMLIAAKANKVFEVKTTVLRYFFESYKLYLKCYCICINVYESITAFYSHIFYSIHYLQKRRTKFNACDFLTHYLYRLVIIEIS